MNSKRNCSRNSKARPNDDFSYNGIEEYLYLCKNILKRYSNLKDGNEGMSVAMGALMHAHRVYMMEKREGNFISYANKAIARALGKAVERQKRVSERCMSLEEIEANSGIDKLLLAKEERIDVLELAEEFMDFLRSLNETDREIILFRAHHPLLSLAKSATILSSHIAGVPSTQSGLTKRLQKLKQLWQHFQNHAA